MAHDDLDIVGQLEALRRYARVLTRDAEAADDLVQATFVRAHERRATFREGSDVRVWLMAILQICSSIVGVVRRHRKRGNRPRPRHDLPLSRLPVKWRHGWRSFASRFCRLAPSNAKRYTWWLWRGSDQPRRRRFLTCRQAQ